MAEKNFEIRAIRDAIDDYLGSAGWTGIDYREGYKSDQTIIIPSLSVIYLPATGISLQLGGKGAEKLQRRIVQINCYMETEDRAGKIIDDVMDFFDMETVLIKDLSTNTIGTIICPRSEDIYGEVLAPLLTDPKVKRWRGVVRATLEAHYFAP